MTLVSRCPSTVYAYGLKTETCQFLKKCSCHGQGKETYLVGVQIEYGFDCFQLRFGLVGSVVWIGSEYGFVTLSDESASGSHTQNSTWTASYLGRHLCRTKPSRKVLNSTKLPLQNFEALFSCLKPFHRHSTFSAFFTAYVKHN